jgi:hypothetical protein
MSVECGLDVVWNFCPGGGVIEASWEECGRGGRGEGWKDGRGGRGGVDGRWNKWQRLQRWM